MGRWLPPMQMRQSLLIVYWSFVIGGLPFLRFPGSRSILRAGRSRAHRDAAGPLSARGPRFGRGQSRRPADRLREENRRARTVGRRWPGTNALRPCGIGHLQPRQSVVRLRDRGGQQVASGGQLPAARPVRPGRAAGVQPRQPPPGLRGPTARRTPHGHREQPAGQSLRSGV